MREILNSKFPDLMTKIYNERSAANDWEREFSVGNDQSLRCLYRIGHGGSGRVFEVPIRDIFDSRVDAC